MAVKTIRQPNGVHLKHRASAVRRRQCQCSDQNIAAGAMKEGEQDLARRAGPPQRVEQQLRRLPKKMSNCRKADRECDPWQEPAVRGITNGRCATGAHW